MFIVYGTRVLKKHMGTTRDEFRCAHCNNVNHYKITRVRKFFALFWIPLIPYSSKYFVHCPICDYGSEVKKDAIENLIHGPAITASEQPEVSSNTENSGFSNSEADTEFTNNTTDGF
jgi:hypothetical protein